MRPLVFVKGGEMNANEFLIPEKLPGLNEIISAARTNRYVAGQQKREVERLISVYIHQAQKRGELRPIKGACIIRITWIEATKRRDADNIQAGAKFILDAMKHAEIIPDDSQRYVKQVYHEIVPGGYDAARVEIIEDDRKHIKGSK